MKDPSPPSPALFLVQQARLIVFGSSEKLTHKTRQRPVSITHLALLLFLFSRLTEPSGSDPWPGYKYSGPLRPLYPLSPRREVPADIPRPDYAETGIPLSELSVKSSSTIEAVSEADLVVLRKVCQVGFIIYGIDGLSMLMHTYDTNTLSKKIQCGSLRVRSSISGWRL